MNAKVFKKAATPRPAATVVLIRDTPSGLKTLLLRRNDALAVAAGCWVFPGGAIDAADLEHAAGDPVLASRHAAIREAQEEADLTPHCERMVTLGHWTGPAGEPRRFATWYYIAPCSNPDDVLVDGSEIVDAAWLAIDEALARHRSGELALFPPTFLTLCQLRSYRTVAHALQVVADLSPVQVLPVFAQIERRQVALLEGDANYPGEKAGAGDARHRVWSENGSWRYEYEAVPAKFRPLDGRDIPSL